MLPEEKELLESIKLGFIGAWEICLGKNYDKNLMENAFAQFLKDYQIYFHPIFPNDNSTNIQKTQNFYPGRNG